MKQIHKVRLKLSRGLIGYLVGNCLPLNPAFYLLFPTCLLVFVLYNPPQEVHSPFYSQADVVRMDHPCFLPHRQASACG